MTPLPAAGAGAVAANTPPGRFPGHLQPPSAASVTTATGPEPPAGSGPRHDGAVELSPLQQGWCDLLSRYEPWTGFVTLTYDDRKLQERYGGRWEWVMRSATSVLNDAERFLHQAGITRGYFLVAEPTYHRGVWHVHGLIQAPTELFRELWRLWFRDRGACRFETPKGGYAVRAYVSKYVLKNLDSDWVRFDFRRLR